MQSLFLIRDQALSLWSHSINSKTLDYQRTNPAAAAAKSLQSCPTLSDPMDCSLPGTSLHGIFQARVLEWVVISSCEMQGLDEAQALISIAGRNINNLRHAKDTTLMAESKEPLDESERRK